MTDLLRPIRTQEDLATFFLDDKGLNLLDQRALPAEENWLLLSELEDIAVAIETLAVRGAPAIGGAAALAMALFARQHKDEASSQKLVEMFERSSARLRTTRPTAVNLFYALDRIDAVVKAKAAGDAGDLRAAIVDEAEAICTEDAAACQRMAEHGAELFEDGDVVLTVCHTGALATCGIGTALGVLKEAAKTKRISVFALETRPLLQGARLTAWECLKVGLDVTLITDGMVGAALHLKGITRAISGADRVARNGDAANKIGTCSLATLCHAHEVPFYVAAPTTTFDLTLATGAEIPIEERNPDEVRTPRGAVFAPADVPVWNPAFDVTPAKLTSAIITEAGVWKAPFSEADLEKLTS